MSSAEPVRHPVDFASRIIRDEAEIVVAVEGEIDLATVPLLWGSFPGGNIRRVHPADQATGLDKILVVE